MNIPRSEPGLVIRYSYLWLSEYQAGQKEGAKDRPCAVILALDDENGETRSESVSGSEVLHASVRRHGNVGLPKIGPLAQQRGRGVLGQGASKAVAKIKLRWVSSAAIATECLAGKVRLA